MADLVVRPTDLQQLFREVSERLKQIFWFDVIVFTLHNPAKNRMELCYGESSATDLSGLGSLPTEHAPRGWVWLNQTPLLIPDLEKEARFPSAFKIIRDFGIRSYACFPVTLGQKRLG